MELERYSIGIGDRFGRQGRAQLAAVARARAAGAAVTPVWNKSHREHQIIGTVPADTRRAADAAVRAAAWTWPYFVDADHITGHTVDPFLASCDVFTLDVAEAIGRPPAPEALDAFVGAQRERLGRLDIPGLAAPLTATEADVRRIGTTYLEAIREAGRVYRQVAAGRGAAPFVTEVSMDECRDPQTPLELLFILAGLAAEGVPVRTIAPKFSGRFNKGVDYVGDVARFAREFEADLAVVRYAGRQFGLPADLKLSVHSGSDKFSLYAPMRRALQRTGDGLHLKTAGTTWLEELIGLAAAGGAGLALAREIYEQAFARRDALCAPYATVIDIDPGRLPAPAVVRGWDGEAFAAALRHDSREPRFNPHLRQLLHVGYKIAAELGPRYLEALAADEPVISRNVTENLWERHLRPLFVGA